MVVIIKIYVLTNINGVQGFYAVLKLLDKYYIGT